MLGGLSVFRDAWGIAQLVASVAVLGLLWPFPQLRAIFSGESMILILIFYHLRSMGYWKGAECLLLFLNSLAILNEERLLAARGWNLQEFRGGNAAVLRRQVKRLIHAARKVRVTLIILNIAFMVRELVLYLADVM